MMICKDNAVEALLDSQTNIDSDGIVSDEEILPLSILDFTNSELQIVEDYLTPGAYKTEQIRSVKKDC